MPRRSFALALAIPAMIGILVAGFLLLSRSTAAQTGVIRYAGAISIDADNYSDLGHNRTRVTGDIRLGRFLRVSGPGAYVEFARDYLVGHGTLVLDSGGRSRELFSGDFSSTNTELREGLITPGDDVHYDLYDLSGFAITDRLIFTRISTITGIANGEARLALPGPASNDLGTLYGPPVSNDLDVATALADFQIEPGVDGPTIWAELDPFHLPHAGLTIVAPGGAELRDGAITLSDARIGSPTLFTNRTSPLGAVRIDPQAVKLADITVSPPDICFGQPCSTTRLKITGIQATLNNNQFNAEGNLVLNLPGNRQSTRVIFTIGADAQNQPDTSNLQGTIAELNLTLAGSQLNLQQVRISTNGLGADIATLKLPATLGNSSGSVTGIRINGSGLTGSCSLSGSTMSIKLGLVGLPDAPRFDLAPSEAYRAPARAVLMRRGKVTPADMGQIAYLCYCAGLYRTGDDDFVALRIIKLHHAGKRFSGGHQRMGPLITAKPDCFLVRKAKIDAAHPALAAALQFTHPLMRHKEVRHHRHRVDARGNGATDGGGFDAGTMNGATVFFSCNMHKKSHLARPE